MRRLLDPIRAVLLHGRMEARFDTDQNGKQVRLSKSGRRPYFEEHSEAQGRCAICTPLPKISLNGGGTCSFTGSQEPASTRQLDSCTGTAKRPGRRPQGRERARRRLPRREICFAEMGSRVSRGLFIGIEPAAEEVDPDDEPGNRRVGQVSPAVATCKTLNSIAEFRSVTAVRSGPHRF